MAKRKVIVEELGELLLPNLVNLALVANDRAKYLMTLLKTAREHADHPDGGITSLKSERLASGIEDATFDTIVEQSSKEHEGEYRVPALGRLQQQIVENVRTMLAPISISAASLDRGDELVGKYRRRLETLMSHAPVLADNLIPGAYIDQITSAQPDRGDSLPLLVVNLHKELNRIHQQIAAESIEGARVYSRSRPAQSHFQPCLR